MNNQKQTILTFLWSVIKPYKWWYLLMMQAPIIGSFYMVVNSYSLKLLVDGFVNKEIPEYNDLLKPIAIFIVAVLILEIVWRISQFAWLKSQPDVRANIVLKTYDYIQNHSYSFFQTTHSGSIISKIKGIVDGYNNLWFAVHHDITDPLCKTIVTLLALGFINLKLFFFMMVWSLIFFPVMLKLSTNIGILAQRTSDSKHKLIGLLADNLSNIFSMFYFASRARELTKIDQFLRENPVKSDRNQIKYEFKTAILGGVLYIAMLIGLLFFMIHLKRIGAITTGDFVFVMSVTYFLVDNIWNLIGQVGDLSGKMGDFRSAFKIMQIEHDKIDKPNAVEHLITKGEILFKDLTFGYNDGQQIFTELNLTIAAGQKVGIVGHSGSGKSSLIALLLKNFKPSSGDIIIDGVSIYNTTSDSLRLQIALIPQDIMLFHRSIGENIGYPKNGSSQEEIEQAASAAYLHDFITKLPDGYKSLVGERGVKLSGGQRQRIAIARALLKNSPILILDEATSSLDSESEQEIQISIEKLLDRSNATVIAVAHRLSTIRHMDRILVLENGKIIQDGSFDELLKDTTGRFRTLWDHQACGMV